MAYTYVYNIAIGGWTHALKMGVSEDEAKKKKKKNAVPHPSIYQNPRKIGESQSIIFIFHIQRTGTNFGLYTNIYTIQSTNTHSSTVITRCTPVTKKATPQYYFNF